MTEISGKVVSSTDGQPISEYRIGTKPGTLSGNDKWETKFSTGPRSLTIYPGKPEFIDVKDSAGKFILRHVEIGPGRATVFIEIDGKLHTQIIGNLNADKIRDEVIIEVPNKANPQ